MPPGRPRGAYMVAPDQDRWMDELRAARKLVDEATVRLNETIDHARAAGLTYRAIHEGCGIHVQPRFWRRAQKGAADQSD